MTKTTKTTRRFHESDFRKYNFTGSIRDIKAIPVRIPIELREVLEVRAAQSNTSLNSYIHKIIEYGLDQDEVTINNQLPGDVLTVLNLLFDGSGGKPAVSVIRDLEGRIEDAEYKALFDLVLSFAVMADKHFPNLAKLVTETEAARDND